MPARPSRAAASRSSASTLTRSRPCPAGARTSRRFPSPSWPTGCRFRPPAGGWHGRRSSPARRRSAPRRSASATAASRCGSTRIVWTDGGDSARIPLGTIRDGMTSAARRLPDERGRRHADHARSSTTTASSPGPATSTSVFAATVAFEGLDGLVDDRPIDLEVFTVSTVHRSARRRRPTGWRCRPSSARISPATRGRDGALDLAPRQRLRSRCASSGWRDRARPSSMPSPRFVDRAARSVPRRASRPPSRAPDGRPRCGSTSSTDRAHRRGPRGARRRRRSGSPRSPSAPTLVAERAADPLSQAHRVGAGRGRPDRTHPVRRGRSSWGP